MKQLLIAFILLLLPAITNADHINAGFVQGIWYANDPVLAETPTRIYIALRNNTPHDLSGTVRFTDNGKRIGSSEVRALSGRLVEAWVDWTPSFGTHSINATISDAELHIIGGGTEAVDISGIVAESILFVDKDTDGDGIGDAKDDDDDNDSVPDDEEIEKGTDPNDPDSFPEEEEEEVEEEDEVTEGDEDGEAPEEPREPRGGLEKYIKQNPAHSMLAELTDTIQASKSDLDSYRTSRIIPGSDEPSEDVDKDTGTSSTDTEITRTKEEPKKGILTKILEGFMLLFFHLWSFVLFIASLLLAFPALIEIVGLLLFLIILLRIVRRIARRRQQ